MAIVYVFPGQGSQKLGMGKALFAQYPQKEEEASDYLGYSLKRLCEEDPQRQLNQTQYTQVALYVVNALSYLAKQEQHAIVPDYVLGHSLGEYNALLAAGGFSFLDGLRIVQKRGALMCQMQKGKMAAVVGLCTSDLRAFLEEKNFSEIDVANINTPEQIVISGPENMLVAATPLLKLAGARVIMLRVSGAFHSRYMQPIQQPFAAFLQEVHFGRLQLPVVANYTASIYQQAQIVDNLVQQLTHPVRWVESVQLLLSQKIDVFEEIGPGQVLTKLIARIKVEA